MNQINPRKLLNSKWTATQPKNKEKHFLITEVAFNEEGIVEHCLIEAVYSGNEYEIDWRSLKDTQQWRQGWK